MKHASLLDILAILALLAAGSVSAQSPAGYPTRPIRMVVPFAPGGASDFRAKISAFSVHPILSSIAVPASYPHPFRAKNTHNVGLLPH